MSFERVTAYETTYSHPVATLTVTTASGTHIYTSTCTVESWARRQVEKVLKPNAGQILEDATGEDLGMENYFKVNVSQ